MYDSKLVSQVINKLMVSGKKSTAEKIVYDALDTVSRRTGAQRRRGPRGLDPGPDPHARGALAARGRGHLPGPGEVQPRRARTLAVRWLTEFSRSRREKTMAARLAGELMDAQSQQGGAYKSKEDIYRMAQANKAFAHYRW